MKPQIVINADDFGHSASVNKAISESFAKGLINSTTIMANMPGFDEAIEYIYNYKLNARVGVHLVLSEGDPLTETIKLHGLFFKKSSFSSKERIKSLFLINKKIERLIYDEFSAQINKVKSNGVQITHLDSHHQIHDMFAIMKIMSELLKEHNIPSMRILNNLNRSFNRFKNAYRNMINIYLKRRGINFSDYLGDQDGFFEFYKNNPEFISKNKENKIEIMVHPSFNINGDLVNKIGDNEYDLHSLVNLIPDFNKKI